MQTRIGQLFKLFAFALSYSAIALHANAATINVSAGGNINLAIENAQPGDTILIAPGTYTPMQTPLINNSVLAAAFWITKRITLQSTGGAAVTTLSSNGGFEYAVQVRSINFQINGVIFPTDPSGAVIDGFSIVSPKGGVTVLGKINGQPIRDVQLKNLVVTVGSDLLYRGHGVNLDGQENAVVDNVRVPFAADGGIYILGGKGHTIMNSSVDNVRNQHPFILQSTSNNLVLNNIVRGGPLEGIVLNNSSYNRVEGNTITGHKSDGIALTDNSLYNAVVHNTIVSDSYRFNNPLLRTTGVGVWLNCGSNGNWVAGNAMRGSPEVGFNMSVSSNNYVVGNTVSENFQGGILTNADGAFCINKALMPPASNNNRIHRNWAFWNQANGGVVSHNAIANDIAYNFISRRNDIGLVMDPPAGTAGMTFIASPGNKAYRNTIFDVRFAAVMFPNSAVDIRQSNFVEFTQNRFATTEAFVVQAYQSGSPVAMDGNLAIGGNYWNVPGISGNPNPNTTPFTNIVVTNPSNALVFPSPIIDRYPFADENLGKAYGSTIKAPFAGAVMAAGRRTRIEWNSDACGFVNLVYRKGASAAITVARSPNTGYFMWTVPTVAAGSDYQVGVECLTLSGASTGVTNYSPTFSIFGGNLTLLSHHNAHITSAATTTRVAWKKSSAIGGVNVYLGVNGAETLVASNVLTTFADISLPNVISNAARIRIADAGNSAQDGSDGYFSIRAASGANFTSLTSGQKIKIGSIQELNWTSLVGSTLVTLSFFDGAAYRDIATNLADRGSYSWFVPEFATNNARLRIVYGNAAGDAIGSNEVSVTLVYRTDTGVALNRYRLYSPVTLEHLYTTDLNEYDTLRQFPSWSADGVSMQSFNGPNTVGGIALQPYYRMYNPTSRLHYWTIDRSDYFARRATPNWVPEGVDGYIFPTQAAGSVPLFRVYLAAFDKYLWTTDLNEYTILTTQRGWVARGTAGLPAGVEGYVYPPR